MSKQDIPPRQANWAEEVEQDISSEEAFRNWAKPKPGDVAGLGQLVIRAERASETSLAPVSHLSETAITAVNDREVTKIG